MKQRFVAASGIPGYQDFYCVVLELASEDAKDVSDLLARARKAIHEFALTDEGAGVWANTHGTFDWADVANVAGSDAFKAACRYVGVSVEAMDAFGPKDCLEMGESLMEDISVRVSGIDWDADNDTRLPSETVISIAPDEDIADRLSDAYGFCIKSYEAHSA